MFVNCLLKSGTNSRSNSVQQKKCFSDFVSFYISWSSSISTHECAKLKTHGRKRWKLGCWFFPRLKTSNQFDFCFLFVFSILSFFSLRNNLTHNFFFNSGIFEQLDWLFWLISKIGMPHSIKNLVTQNIMLFCCFSISSVSEIIFFDLNIFHVAFHFGNIYVSL